MKLGVVVGDNDVFFRDLVPRLSTEFDLGFFRRRTRRSPVLRERLNRGLLRSDLRSFIRSHDVALFEWASELLAVASRLPKEKPVVVRLHSYELYEWADRIDWNFVDTVIFVSEAMRRRFLESFPGRSRQTRVVSIGKDLDRYRVIRRQQGNVVGMLGALVPIKRVYEMILTIAELRDEGIDFRLLVGGIPGGGADNVRYHKAMLRLIDRLALRDVVAFAGHVSRPEEWLGGIDAFVSNSYWEGQQNALLEAMATGCVCLCHGWDGAEEILPAECIFLSGAELKAKLAEFAAMSAGERTRRGLEMRRIVEDRFDLRQMADAFVDVLREVEG